MEFVHTSRSIYSRPMVTTADWYPGFWFPQCFWRNGRKEWECMTCQHIDDHRPRPSMTDLEAIVHEWTWDHYFYLAQWYGPWNGAGDFGAFIGRVIELAQPSPCEPSHSLSSSVSSFDISDLSSSQAFPSSSNSQYDASDSASAPYIPSRRLGELTGGSEFANSRQGRNFYNYIRHRTRVSFRGGKKRFDQKVWNLKKFWFATTVEAKVEVIERLTRELNTTASVAEASIPDAHLAATISHASNEHDTKHDLRGASFESPSDKASHVRKLSIDLCQLLPRVDAQAKVLRVPRRLRSLTIQ